jgi:hypothetical protein
MSRIVRAGVVTGMPASRRVDAGVNAVEPRSVGANRDCLPADAERYELAGRDNAVLAGREGADRPVQRGLDEFVKHSLT